MRKYWSVLILLLITAVTKVYADDVSFVIKAPNVAVEGGQISVQYILTGGTSNEIKVPDNIDGFEILYGPGVSKVYNSSNINGKVSSQSSVIYTYTLLAKKEGTYTLPKATVKLNGRVYATTTKQIKVLPPDKNNQAPAQQGGGNAQPNVVNPNSKDSRFDSNDAFFKLLFSKTKVYDQEAVLVTFRFYSTLDIRDVGGIQFPDFEGFMVEDVELPYNRYVSAETYRGKNYYTIDVKKTLLFPQRSGKLTIPSGTLDVIFAVPSGQYINGPSGKMQVMSEIRRVLNTPPTIIDVTPLPTTDKPLGFSGGVGTFTINSSISSTKVKANENVTLKLNIEGVGNGKLIKTPEVQFPSSFEVFDPKITNDLVITDNGLAGTKTIEYSFIPRDSGTYTIPEIVFSYFDLRTKTYKTLKTTSYTIQVAEDLNAGKGSSKSYMNQQEVEVENDIRYLKTTDFKFTNSSNFLWGNVAYVLWYIIPLLLFVAFFIYNRQQIKATMNATLTRVKKANKVAKKRLKLANKYLLEKNKDKFYEEVLRAVWGYLSDKLSIPVADLNRENIEFELSKWGTDQLLISQFISILDNCEFARYTRLDSDKEMGNLYQETIDAIGKMENIVKIK